MRKPLITLDAFVEAHMARDQQLNRYLASGWGRRRFGGQSFDRLTQRAAMSLYATNGRARIEVARAAKRAFYRLAATMRADADVWFLTVAPKAFAGSLSEADTFDHSGAVDLCGEILRKRDYIGIFEAAYYSNLELSPGSSEGLVSWHFHILLWNASKAEVSDLLARFSEIAEPLIPGRKAVHGRRLKPSALVGNAIYMMKAPLDEYRVIPVKEEMVDADTGEVTIRPGGTFDQKTRDLRPGDALRMYEVLGDRTIPTLAFSDGGGAKVLADIFRVARRRLRSEDRQRQRRLRDLTGLC